MMTMQDQLALLRVSTRYNEIFKKERWITCKEAGVLASMIDDNPRIMSYFECGTANGFSTCVVADRMRTREYDFGLALPLHTWDPHDRTKVWKFHPHLERRIRYHQKKYTDSVREVVPPVRRGQALFFIDGDHRGRAARADIRATLEVSRPGDIMLLHDVKDYEWLNGRFKEFEKTHRTKFFDTERGMGAVWL